MKSPRKDTVTSQVFDERSDHHVRGFHPLGAVANSSVSQLKHLDFSADECITDAVLYQLTKAKGWKFKELKTINLTGCRYITDRGMKWLAQIIKKSEDIHKIAIDGLEKVTENCFPHLVEATTIRLKITGTGSGIRYIKPFEDQLIIDTGDSAIDEDFSDHQSRQNVGHVLVCPEQSTQYSLTAFLSQRKKRPLKPLFFHNAAGIAWTEIHPKHPWFEKIVPEEPSVVVIPYDSSADSQAVQDHVFQIIGFFVGRSPPVLEKYKSCRFIVVGIGGEISALKKCDMSTALGIKHLEDFIKEKERTLNDLNQLEQEQYAQALKMVENFKVFVQTKGFIQFTSIKVEGSNGLQDFIKLVTDAVSADQKERKYRYQFPYFDMDETFALLAKQLGFAITLERFDEYVGKVIKPGDIRRDRMLAKLFHTLGRCIYLENGHESLIVLNIPWFFDLMNDLMTTNLVSCKDIVPCLSPDIQGMSEDEMMTLVKTCGQDYCPLLRLIWSDGPVVTLPCTRAKPDEQKLMCVNLQDAQKPPVPLNHYWQEDKEEKYLYMARCVFKLISPVCGDTLSRLAALVSNTARFQILSTQGFVIHHGAVEVILLIKSATEIMLESRTLSPPGNTSMAQEKKDLRKYMWSVLHLHYDFLEYVLKQQNALYTVVWKGGDCGPWNYSICSHHTWEKPILAPGEIMKKITVCSLCGNCSCDGGHCDYNNIPPNVYQECGCETDVTACWNCGICRKCAEIFWRVKSSLRPNQGDWKHMVLKDLSNVSCKLFLTSTDINTAFNQVDMFTPEDEGPYVALIDIDGSNNIQVFPGTVKTITKSTDEVKEKSLPDNLRWRRGDCLSIRLKTPEASAKNIEDGDSMMKMLYNSHISRRVRLWQAEGILAYTPLTSSPPVGIFVGKLPMTPENDYFEIKVIDRGQKGTISIGIVPENYKDDKQVGWQDRAVGYHGDDGGIYLSSGYAQKNLTAWSKGDVIGCGVDFNDDDTKSLYFCHNGVKKYVLTGVDRLPQQVFPAIAFHSRYEKVQLLTENVWRATDQMELVKSSFKDADTVYGEDVHISPSKKLMFEKAAGWGDKRISCVFVKNVSDQNIVIAVRPKGSDYHVERFNAVLERGDIRVVYVRSDTKDPSEDLTGDTFLVVWDKVSPTMDGSDLERIVKKLDDHPLDAKCHKLRFEWVGTESAQSKLKPFDEDRPTGESQILEVIKNGVLTSKYWVPRATYHVQFAFPRTMDSLINEVSVHMPRQATFDLPHDFEPGMILEYSPPGMDVFVAGVIKEVMPKGKLVIEPKHKPKNADIVNTVLDAKSKSICPLARPPQELPKIKGIEPTDLWDVAPATLFTKEQITEKMEGHLWGFCFKRGTRCKSKKSLYTVQEAQIRNLSMELLLPDFLEKLNPDMMRPCTFLPDGLNEEKIRYPTMSCLSQVTDLNVHPLCYPVGQHTHHQLAARPHILDSGGVRASIEPDAIFRNLATAWAFAYLATRKSTLGAWSNLVEGGASINKALVNQQLQRIFSSYTSTVNILALRHGGIKGLMDSEVHAEALKEAMKSQVIVDMEVRSGWCDPKKIVYVPEEPECVCAAHFYSRERESWPSNFRFKPELFTPYEAEQVYLEIDLKPTEKLPAEFFSKFENLDNLHIKRAHGIEQLPQDFGMIPKLSKLTIFDTGLRTLPKIVNGNSLTRVAISASGLTEIPDAICNLPNLGLLDLSENPISQITPNISKLRRSLKSLNISGVPWFTFQNAGGILPPDWYDRDNFTTQEKQNLKLITKEKMSRLFEDCDLDHNGMLDQKELPNLNAQMFYLVSRIGLDYETGDADGGFPMEILTLEELEDLHLENQAIHAIPPEIEQLKKLRHLNLRYNPLLEAIPGTMGTMTALESINLRSCPSLKTPPIEIVSRGIGAIKAYLKYLSADETECHRTKLMMVGLGGAGKTSLLRALTCGEYKTKPTVGEDITDGIDIGTWTVTRSDDQEITFSTWDFAGQTIYYNTHQFFLSKRAVYLLLWTTRLGYEHAGLDFWLSSISCHAPDTPIFVIGTHCDQVAKVELPRQELKDRYKQIIGFHFVSSITGMGIRELQEQLLDTALNQHYMGEQIPKIWLSLEERVLEARHTTSIMKWKTLQEEALDVGIFDEKDTKQAVQLLHDLGTVQYFDNEFLRDYVVINPQWIVDVMSCIVSVKESPIRDGKFFHKDMKTVWKKEKEELLPWLLRLTERFDLTFPLLSEDANLVPCLLPQREPVIDWVDTALPDNDTIREMKIVYKFSYLPAGLFNRSQVRLFEFSDSSRIWKQGSLLEKNGHQALIRQTNDQELVVRVQGLRPQNIVFMIHEVFELLIKESFNGVQCDLYLPCPDCLNKEKTRNPALMKAGLIRHAMELKAPYLQCRKYFHTISMPELQAIVPPDSTMDFDIQMEASILLLRDLRQEMATDICFLYCVEDLVGKGGGPTCPRKIADDMGKEGYKVNFPSHQASVEDMTLGLKDSKMVIVCMSNNFEWRDDCCDLFQYARDTLGKPMLVCGVGPNMDWQRGKTGGRMAFVVSDVVYINFTRPDQYGAKIAELKSKTKDKLEKSSMEKKYPQCFVSYCWSNSHEAIANGMRVEEEDTLGWADPREIKRKIEEAGISCWLDVEQTGTKGLFEDISDGIKYCDVILACVSKEYKNSVNCMMELRFAVTTMNKPVVFAVVGQGDEWEQGEIGMLISRKIQDMHDPHAMPKISFQEESKNAYSKLIAKLKSDLKEGGAPPSPTKKIPRVRPVMKNSMSNNNIVFQEEYELLQRKYLRQVTSFSVEGFYPRLFVLDFADEVEDKKSPKKEKFSVGSECGADMSTVDEECGDTVVDLQQSTKGKRGMKRERTLLDKRKGNVDDWRNARMCFRVLCEHDQGWHQCGASIDYNVSAERRVIFLHSVAPYLLRMYNILKHSGVKLQCLSGIDGEKYMNFIRECVSSDVNADVETAYNRCRDMVRRYDPERKMGDLDRCLLPSGKLLWLCKDHQKNKRVIVLSSDMSSGEMGAQVVFEEDMLLKEALVKYGHMVQPYLINRPPNKMKIPVREKSARPEKGKIAALGSMMGSTLKWQTVAVSKEKRMSSNTPETTPAPTPTPKPTPSPRAPKQKPALTRKSSSSVACVVQ